MHLLSFPRFWTLSIERFWFLFWSILNGVKLKTSKFSIADVASEGAIHSSKFGSVNHQQKTLTSRAQRDKIAGNYRIRGQKKIASRSSLLHGSRFHSVVTQRSSLLHRWRVTFLLDASVSRYRRPLKLRDFVWEIKYWDLRTLNNVTSNFSFNGLTCGERGGGKRKECVPFVY